MLINKPLMIITICLPVILNIKIKRIKNIKAKLVTKFTKIIIRVLNINNISAQKVHFLYSSICTTMFHHLIYHNSNTKDKTIHLHSLNYFNKVIKVNTCYTLIFHKSKICINWTIELENKTKFKTKSHRKFWSLKKKRYQKAMENIKLVQKKIKEENQKIELNIIKKSINQKLIISKK